MGTSWGEESFLGSALLSVFTYYFLCLFPWPFAFFSECSSLLFLSIQGPYPCKHSLMLVLLSWEMGDSWQCFFAGADLWMPFGPGSRVPEGGSGRVDQLGAGASGSHWSWAYNMWAHMVPQMQCKSCMCRCSFPCVSVAWHFRQLCWFGDSEEPSVPPGIRDQSGAAAGVLPPTPRAAGHKVLESGPEKVEA